MATLQVVDSKNKKSGSVELDPTVFEAAVKPHLFHAEVRRQLAGRRSGTHSTKNRTAVSGGGAKPYRQKGTGRARQGTTRAAQFAGGGIVFGPVPRDYEHKLTKKMRRAALRGAVSLKLRDEQLTVVDSLELDEFKTKRVAEMLSALGLDGQTVLLVTEEAKPQFEASARNLPGVSVVRAEGLNVYDVLRHGHLVISQAAVEKVSQRLQDSTKGEDS